jgi:hypothetical protein
MDEREAGRVFRISATENVSLQLADLLIVDGNPLDEMKALKYVLVTFRDGVPWFDPMGPTVPGVKEVGRAW